MDDEYTIKKNWYRIYQQHMINTGLWSEQNKELDFMGEQFKNINNETFPATKNYDHYDC